MKKKPLPEVTEPEVTEPLFKFGDYLIVSHKKWFSENDQCIVIDVDLSQGHVIYKIFWVSLDCNFHTQITLETQRFIENNYRLI